MTLLVLPTILMLPVCLGIDAAVVRAHPRGVAVAILLAAMHSELVSMLPWRTTTWAGFSTRNVLLCVVAMLLLALHPGGAERVRRVHPRLLGAR